MTTTIKIPANLRTLCDNESSAQIDEAATVGEALRLLVERFPNLEERLLTADGSLVGHISLFLGGISIRDLDGMETPISGGSELLLVTALAGG